MELFATIATVAGTVMSVGGQLAAAADVKAAGDRALAARIFESQLIEQQSGQAKAASQRRALEEQRKARLIASRAQAVAAGSGAGAADPTVVNLIADITGEGSYRSSVELYQGEEEARQLHLESLSRLQRGFTEQAGARSQSRALRTQAFATLLQSAGGLASKYGGSGPPSSAGAGAFDSGTPGFFPYA